MTLQTLLAGGTGLVGGLVAQALSARRDVALVSLVRRGDRPFERVVDFEALVRDPGEIGDQAVDVAISCLGTTIRAAGTRPAFRRVDHDYVLAVARAAQAHGARQFILVSSVGAGGRGFYLGVKGEVEAGARALGFDRLDIVRPGLLLGPRAERRPGERLAQRAAPLLAPLLRGPFDRYDGVPATAVAEHIAALVGASTPGVHVHHNRELRGR